MNVAYQGDQDFYLAEEHRYAGSRQKIRTSRRWRPSRRPRPAAHNGAHRRHNKHHGI